MKTAKVIPRYSSTMRATFYNTQLSQQPKQIKGAQMRTSVKLPTHHSSIDYMARWNSLRGIGNSAIGKAAIAVPILGYMIIFHNDLVDFLKMHHSICHDCSVSWRINMLYFGSSIIAAGSIIYALRCPPLVKMYGGATEFYRNEGEYFSNSYNFDYLKSLIKYDRDVHEYSDEVVRSIGNRGSGDPENLLYLAGIMGEYYVLQNMSYPGARMATALLYLVGSIFVAIPTIVTFIQVSINLLASTP